MDEIEQKFKNQLRSMLKGESPTAIAVMVSGGPDSMVLCYLANQFCQEHNIALHVVIVNHKLRSESTAEAESTQAFLNQKQIRVEILPWHGEKPKSNIQEIARKKRYELVTAYCKKHVINHVLTGHHKDDQAETVMLRIMRGSGIKGVSGIDFISRRHGFKLLRPMLEFDKAMIMACIEKIGWNYCQDPSNLNEDFERVRVRKLFENPEWEPLKEKLVLLADNARRTNSYITQQTEQFLQHNCVYAWSTASLDIGSYRQLHEEIALRALSSILSKVGGNQYSPRLTQLKRLYSELLGSEFKNRTLWGCFIKMRQGKVFIIREEADIKQNVAVKAGEEFIWDNRFIINSSKDGYISTIKKYEYAAVLKPLLQTKTLASPEVIATLPAFFDEGGVLICVYGLYESEDSGVSISY